MLGGSYSDYVWHDAQGAWDTDRLTRVLKRETGKRLGVVLHALDYRHSAVGSSRVKVGESCLLVSLLIVHAYCILADNYWPASTLIKHF